MLLAPSMMLHCIACFLLTVHPCCPAWCSQVGEFFSVALTNNMQQADTGTKMVHVGKHTRSRIVSKGISAGNSRNAYRGLVQVSPMLARVSVTA